MEENYYLVNSITYAMKGQTVLQSRGIRAYVVRDRQLNTRGCGYAIQAAGEQSRILALLEAGHVKINEVREVRG